MTAETIIGNIRTLLKEDSGSDLPVLSDSFLLTAISDGNLKWAEAFQTSGTAPIVFQRETGFDLKAETAINDAAGTTTASTSITVDAQTFPDSAGVAVVWDDDIPDLFSYTSQTSTLFSGVSGLAFAHEDNDPIAALYKLPTNFGDFRQAVGYGDGVRVEGVGLNFKSGPPSPGYFSMYDDGTSKYLWLPRQLTGSASVWYDKNSTTIDSIDDTVDVPETSAFFLVFHAMALCYLGRENNYNLMIAAQNESNKILQRALQNRNRNSKIRPRSFSRPIVDSINGFPIYR